MYFASQYSQGYGRYCAAWAHGSDSGQAIWLPCNRIHKPQAAEFPIESSRDMVQADETSICYQSNTASSLGELGQVLKDLVVQSLEAFERYWI